MALGRGTDGYADEAEALIEQYERLSFEDVHRQVLHLIATVPGPSLRYRFGNRA
jgi:hypothetical protein